MKKVNIVDSFTLINRGIVLATDMDYDSEHSNFNKGDEIEYNGKTYIVLTIEALTKKGFKDYLSFVTKEQDIKLKYLNTTDLKSKQKVAFVELLLAHSNEDLLDDALSAQVADDWDGCFSKQGEWERDKSVQILKDRMKATGWIS